MCWHVRAIRRAILCSHNLSWFTCRPGKHQRHRAFLSVQASSFAFVTPVGPVSVSATGLFAHAGQRICLCNPCRPGKRQRHRAFCPCRPALLPLEPCRPGKRQRHRAFCRVALRLPGLHCAYCLYGSERRSGSLRNIGKFLSCLHGSEHDAQAVSARKQFLSCLHGSEPGAGGGKPRGQISKLPARQ